VEKNRLIRRYWRDLPEPVPEDKGAEREMRRAKAVFRSRDLWVRFRSEDTSAAKASRHGQLLIMVPSAATGSVTFLAAPPALLPSVSSVMTPRLVHGELWARCAALGKATDFMQAQSFSIC
jgi:hypothetical protein